MNIQTAFSEYKSDLDKLVVAYKAIRLSDAFVNIANVRIEKDILKKQKLDLLLSKVIEVYPDKYLNDLFLVRLVTLLEEYLKNRLIQEFRYNTVSVKKFLLGYNSERKLTPTDVLNGPTELALGYLDDILFHNMPKVERIYSLVFGFDIKNLCDFKRIVLITKMRHLLVHNGGKTNNKEKIKIFRLQTCLDEINKLIENIEFSIKYKRPKKVIKIVDIEGFEKELMEKNMLDLIEYDFARVFGKLN